MENFKVHTLWDTGANAKFQYTHWSNGITMYIEKDGVKMELNGDEVKQLVKSLPRTVGGKY